MTMSKASSDDTLTCEMRKEGTSLWLVLVGSAVIDTRGQLEQALSGLHREACEHKSREAVVDLRPLEFMNSSCFKSFLTWLTHVKQLSADQRYLVRFVSNPETLWQRRSLHAIKAFAADLITLE